MLCKEIVGDGYPGGAVDHVDEAIGGTSKITVIDPHVRGVKYVDGVAIRATSVAEVGRAISYNPGLPGLTIMDANTMYDHMAHMLYSYARPICNLNPNPSPINCFVTIYHELIFQLYDHVPSKNNP